MTWNPPSDSELAPGKPILATIMQRLRDLTASAFAGDSGAPILSRNAISAGGTGADGALTNPAGVVGLGYFEPSSILFTAAGPLPAVTVMRVSGNVRISDIITLDRVGAADALRIQQHLRGRVGAAGASNTSTAGGTTAGAGANIGSAGDGIAAGIDLTGLRWPWNSLVPLVGGKGGDLPNVVGAPIGGLGGGSLILLVEGTVDCTSGTIRCNGDPGTNQAGTTATGAGAGGSIVIACTGTLTGGTYEAKGGAAASGTSGCGAGGGRIALIAPTFAGSRTKTVTGGAGASGGVAGGNGLAEEITLTAPQIRGLFMRSY